MESLWILTTKAGDKLTLVGKDLVNTLMGKVHKTEKSDIDALSQTFAEYLEANGVLHRMRLIDAIHMGFSMGYFYRVFLEKNDVEVRSNDVTTEHNHEDIHDEPTGTTGGATTSQ